MFPADNGERLTGVLANMLDRSSALVRLRGKIALAAQTVYDSWRQDENGLDPDLGSGGICDKVADAIVDVIAGSASRIVTERGEDDEHAFVVCLCHDGVFIVDIPPSLYEIHHGLFHWEKKTGVKFNAESVAIDCIEKGTLGAALYFDPDVLAIAFEEFRADLRHPTLEPAPIGPGG